MPRLTLEDTAAYRLPALLPLREQDRVLVVGSGAGTLAEMLAAHVRFRTPTASIEPSAPLSSGTVDGGASRLAQADPSALPFRERTFTVVICGHQIRSWDDSTLQHFLNESWRVLTHNGIVVLWEVAPSSSAAVNRVWRRILRQPNRSVRLRALAELGRAGRTAGFAWIQTLRLQPFLWPPGPRLAVLLRKEYYDKETISLAPGETPD